MKKGGALEIGSDINSLKLRIHELEKQLDDLKKTGDSVKKDSEVRNEDNSDLSLMFNITLNLLETVEKRKVLRKIIEGAIKLIGLDIGVLYMLNDGMLFLEASVPEIYTDYPREFRIAKLDNHLHIKKVVLTRAPLLVNDIQAEELTPEEKLVVGYRNMHSVLYIPLFAMQKVAGIVILGTFERRYEFSRREVELCRTLSNIGSLSLENSLLFEQLKGNLNEMRRTISKKERIEQRLRLLFRAVEHSPVSIVVTDHKGTIEYVNPKFTDLTGFTRKEAIGKNPRILKSGQHSPGFYKQMWDTIKSGSDWVGEMKNKKKNGEYYWESVFISPMTDDTGHISHFVGVKEDITEKKSMLQNLIAAKEKAEESDRLKTAFLHNISHEIRTPLNAIVGFSTFLNDPDITPEKRKIYSDIIISSNDQLLYIIDGIMKISHLETRQVSLTKADSSVQKVVSTLFNQFNPVAANKNLEFTLKKDNIDENTVLHTDEGKLKQILSNLLDNAFKFTSNGFVEFGCRRADKTIEFYVRDSGIGIPEAEHEKIFERFYQAEKPGNQVYSGTGLGLSICSGYAGLLGGSLTVNSVPGSGSVFTLRLPFTN